MKKRSLLVVGGLVCEHLFDRSGVAWVKMGRCSIRGGVGGGSPLKYAFLLTARNTVPRFK